MLDDLRERIADLQDRLYAESTQAVLLVLQGLDASGKDGVIRSVFSGATRSASVPPPSACPRRPSSRTTTCGGSTRRCRHEARSASSTARTTRTSSRCGCTRSRPRASGAVGPRTSASGSRCSSTRARRSSRCSSTSRRRSSGRRLQERVDDPRKRWKFRMGDLEVRERFDEFVAAWEEVIGETSTDWAPWHVVPADRNWVKIDRGRDARRGRARAARPEDARGRARDRGTGHRVSAAASVLASRHDRRHRAAGAAARLRGVHQDRRELDAPAHVRAVRQGRLLRQLAEPPRDRALRGDRPSADPLRRAVRGVAAGATSTRSRSPASRAEVTRASREVAPVADSALALARRVVAAGSTEPVGRSRGGHAPLRRRRRGLDLARQDRARSHLGARRSCRRARRPRSVRTTNSSSSS